jgi:hypothetical protein
MNPPDTPAIGAVASLSRRTLWVRWGVLVGIAVLALVVRGSGVLSSPPADPTLPPMPGAAKVVPGLIRAGVPSEDEMVQLRDTLNVRVIVGLGAVSVEERAAAGGLGLQVVNYPLAEEAAPTAEQVNELTALVAAMTADGGGTVYLHGTTDSGAAPTMAALVQLTGGTPLPEVTAALGDSDRAALSPAQQQALQDAATALADPAAATGPYAGLEKLPR